MRVARTCRRLGVSTVAVFSEADADAPWLDEFDHRVGVGPAHPGRSYLDQDAILQAAVQTQAQAIHPGWGFLAENAVFAARVRQLQIAWVGPPPNAIRTMGDKALARATMAAAGMPTIPGSEGVLPTVRHAERRAEEIGYPVLLKATAGGGGRGMRICRDATQLHAAYTEASREAEAAFGNAGLYMERFIEAGRHIEFQVLGDSWGHAVHFGERECSVQRRHQKLIEEAPSPVVTDEQRALYGARATQATAALGYEGAGTMELLRDADGSLYFMEMNTRLQVEHPVTECITGADLVELQLRVAAGERLELTQESISSSGHAIEARINAEDPGAHFQPKPGPVTRFDIPTDLGPGRVRVDTHMRPPCDVPAFYDSLIAKIIVHADDRPSAIETLRRCLEAARVEEVPTTIPAHLKLIAHPDFASGTYDTSLVEKIRFDSTGTEG